MVSDRLIEIIEKFGSRRIAVVGDFFLDKYLYFDPEISELSLETGKTARQVVRTCCSPGAAGNVVKNLISLGAGEVCAVGFTGDDGEGFELRRLLHDAGCDVSGLIVDSGMNTPTYMKPQDITVDGIAGEQGRYDIINHSTLPTRIEEHLLNTIRSIAEKNDAVVVIDQVEHENTGAVTDSVRSLICSLGARMPSRVFWADSRRRAGLYSDVILKCNSEETALALGVLSEHLDWNEVAKLGGELSRQTRKPVFLTGSERGMCVFEGEKRLDIDAVRVDGPIDPTGAGDSVTAGAVLALASGSSLYEAGVVGNLAASVTIQKLGTTGTVSPEEIISAHQSYLSQK